MKKRLLALMLALGMTLSLTALAVEDDHVPATPGEPLEQEAQGDVMPISAGGEETAPQMQPIDPWAWDAMSEAAALGMWDDSYYYCIQDEITDGQLDALCAATADKLALLSLPASAGGESEALVIDHTRLGVMNALYQQAAAYELDGIGEGAVTYLTGLGVVRGDGDTLAETRPCTLQEALVMAQRLVLKLYDLQGAGSQGFLWKAEGNGNTLYLLGTIHVDRENIYPLNKELRDIIAGADDAVFEADFGDAEDLQAFLLMQFYDDGTGMKDHVSAELYQRAVEVGAALPVPYTVDEATVNAYKPWAYANMVNSVSLLIGEDSLESPMALDAYVYSKAVNNGVQTGAVESWTFQGKIFDELSQEYQTDYLDGILKSVEAVLAGNLEESSVATISDWVGWWKSRDAEAFMADYDKDAELAEDDEMSKALLLERDPGMIAYADNYLKSAEPHTGILVVGAAHMVGSTGVVQGLKDLGYTVELMPAA